MLRQINRKDIAQVIILLQELSGSENLMIDREILVKSIDEINKLEHIRLIGFETENKIVGMCTLIKINGISNSGRPFAIIENVVVSKEYQNKKIGSQLIQYAINIAKGWNCYKLILETGSKQEWKHRFYEKCGLIKGEKTAFIKRF